MRIRYVSIEGFKRIEAIFPWASAVVLFGANDSGKSNIIEALRGPPYREDPVEDESIEETYLGPDYLVELDGLDLEGSRDQELLVHWLGPVRSFADEPCFALLRDSIERLAMESDRAKAVAAVVQQFRSFAKDYLGCEIAGGHEPLTQSGWFLLEGLNATWVAPVRRDSVDSPVCLKKLWDLADWGTFSPIRAISVDDHSENSDDLYQLLEHFVSLTLSRPVQLGGSVVGSDRVPPRHEFELWLERCGERVSVSPEVAEICSRLADEVNAMVVGFVSRAYEVRVVPLLPDQWCRHDGHRVAVRLRPRLREQDFDLSAAASGVALWVRYAILEVLRVAEERREPELEVLVGEKGNVEEPVQKPQLPQHTLYILDEPERHLHPLAQVEAAEWVAARAKAGADVLLATHAVPFLDLPLEDVEYLKVARDEDWTTRVERITDDIMGTVLESAEVLGLPPVALIQLTRGWLVVEGEHDRLILEAFYGKELRRAGLQMLPLRGAGRAKASFLNLAALAPLKIPFFCLLDNVRAEVVRKGRLPKSVKTEEEKVAEQLIRLRDDEHVDLREVLGLPHPDIICELPIESLRMIAKEHGGRPDAASSWEDLVQEYRLRECTAAGAGMKRPDFKHFVFRETLGIRGEDLDGLIREALLVSSGPPEESRLGQIVRHLVASVGERALSATHGG